VKFPTQSHDAFHTNACEGGLRGRRGRLFEITLEGEIVWEYLTPYFDGVGGHEIYRCVRYPSTYIHRKYAGEEGYEQNIRFYY